RAIRAAHGAFDTAASVRQGGVSAGRPGRRQVGFACRLCPRNAYQPRLFGALASGVAVGLHGPVRVSKRVLVVDDMPYLRDVQVMLLTEAGYCATALGNAREALDRLTELAPDLILLDMSMPEVERRQFLARLRATPR